MKSIASQNSWDLRVDEVRGANRTDFISGTVNALCARFVGWNVQGEQKEAWAESLGWIHDICSGLRDEAGHWLIRPECHLPLISDRPDFVIDCGSRIVVVEAKTGTSLARHAAMQQATRYAEAIRRLLAAGSEVQVSAIVLVEKVSEKDAIYDAGQPIIASPGSLEAFLSGIKTDANGRLPGEDWVFDPRPDVVQAAVELVAMNEDRAIHSTLSDDEELDRLLMEIVSHCNNLGRDERAVFFVSGAPGTGKTLVGLRLAHDERVRKGIGEGHSIYLSGNGPLVDVLTESLARDHARRTGTKLFESRLRAKTKIRLIHGFHAERNEFRSALLVFDEGQRVWTEAHMRRKHFDSELGSEAAELLSAAHLGGARVVVVLIGNGQEINTGEEGISTWLQAIESVGVPWKVFVPKNLVPEVNQFSTPVVIADLELRTPRRTGKNADLSSWVNEVLEGHIQSAKAIADGMDFPLYATRHLEDARAYLRARNGRGERVGILASSQSDRLRLFGLNVPNSASDDYPWVQWFLDDMPNIRSSNALETAASEFKCQGLELDATCVAWSWDMVLRDGNWRPRTLDYRTGAWRSSHRGGEDGRYAKNAYRVLLTRARRALVIYIPLPKDQLSCSADEMSDVWNMLQESGVKTLSQNVIDNVRESWASA